MAFKTPGVYVQEISLFPPSVAEVETAVPAFIGYTEKAAKKGADLTNKPTKISSLLEYRELFGGGYEIAAVDVVVDASNNYAVTSVAIPTRFYLYESLRLFFDNGGGNCYIVSVGNYAGAITNTDAVTVGLKSLEKVDEPTILLCPDATLLPAASESQFYTLQQLTLTQCARLQDRVAVFDLFERDLERDHDAGVESFRNGIGINNLKYGAAYTPWLYTTYARTVDFALFRDRVKERAASGVGDPALELANLTSDSNLNSLVAATNAAIGDRGAIEADLIALRGTSPTVKDRYKSLKDAIGAAADDGARDTAFQALLGFLRTVAAELVAWDDELLGTNLAQDLDTYAASTMRPALEALVALEKNADVLTRSDLANATEVNEKYAALDATGWLSSTVAEVAASTTDYDDGAGATVLETLQAVLVDLDALFQGAEDSVLGFVAQVQDAARTHADMTQTLLYQEHSIIGNVVEHVKREMSRVPPSGAIAGVYAFVDGARGVWKSPANVSLSAVLAPVVPFDDADQEDLNVDVNAGKSINAIRAFTGRGTVVWGARTLAGNDNEWRYVSVRRFFNMVEESVKKSTSFAVFEPNAAPLWTKVKSLIANYLIQKWRDGALAGATPDEAFFVKVGLGETMTAQDVLEGRMNVEIGMAVVRPAEFIVLKFSHKLQES
jgi:phage tail sheath protein FI